MNKKNAPVTGKMQNLNGKTMAAVVLVGIMAVLWGRVLLKGKGGPAEVSAQEITQMQTAALQNEQPADTLIPVTLETRKGRHDVLSDDMFSTDRMDVFAVVEEEPVEEEPVTEPQQPDYRAKLEKVAATLKLEAVIHDADGKPYQVFVNDAIYTVGSVLTVNEGPDRYELVLRTITENQAKFAWNNVSITLTMTETVEK